MHLDELDSFIHVARLNSFSAAAEQLHISQPAMSKRIQSLENRLGVTLFDRLGKRVRLTPAGELLVGKANAMLDCPRTWSAILAICPIRQRTVESGDLSPYWLTSSRAGAASLYQAYPDVELDIQFEDSEVAYNLVQAGAIELAVVTSIRPLTRRKRNSPRKPSGKTRCVLSTRSLCQRDVFGPACACPAFCRGQTLSPAELSPSASPVKG